MIQKLINPFLGFIISFPFLSLLHHFLSLSIPASSFSFPFYPSLHCISLSLSIQPLLNNFLSLYSIGQILSLLHNFLYLSIFSLLIIYFPFLPFSYYIISLLIISFPFLPFSLLHYFLSLFIPSLAKANICE